MRQRILDLDVPDLFFKGRMLCGLALRRLTIEWRRYVQPVTRKGGLLAGLVGFQNP